MFSGSGWLSVLSYGGFLTVPALKQGLPGLNGPAYGSEKRFGSHFCLQALLDKILWPVQTIFQSHGL